MRVRAAAPADAAVICDIYNQGIDDRIATFETAPRTVADVRTWFNSSHPIVVVEDAAGRVIAFASTSPYRSRVFVENAPSRRLCQAVGFREVGTYLRHAQLDGTWRDVVIVERLLDDR